MSASKIVLVLCLGVFWCHSAAAAMTTITLGDNEVQNLLPTLIKALEKRQAVEQMRLSLHPADKKVEKLVAAPRQVHAGHQEPNFYHKRQTPHQEAYKVEKPQPLKAAEENLRQAVAVTDRRNCGTISIPARVMVQICGCDDPLCPPCNCRP